MLLKGNKLILTIAFLALIITMSIGLFRPQIIRLILDDAIMNKKIELLINLILVYISIIIISIFFRLIIEYIYAKIRRKISANLKIKILNHIYKLSGRYYSNIKTGELLNILENDVAVVENFGMDIVFNLIVDILTIIITITILINMDISLLSIILIVQLIMIIFQSKLTKIIAKKTKIIREKMGILTSMAQEYIYNIQKIVIAKSRLIFFKNYTKKQRKLANKHLKLEGIIYTNSIISNILNSLITILIYGIGGIKIIKGNMTIGELIIFQQYTNMLISPCIRLIRSNVKIQQSLVSVERIFSILDEEIEIKQNNKGIKSNQFNEINFINVNFSYNDKIILNNVNLVLKKGEINAIVGESGSGKSTLVNLLFRLWDTNNGQITIDKINIKKYNLKYLRENISFVTQELLMLNDTVFNNLTLGEKNIDIKDIEKLCEKIGVLSTIHSFENGFETVIGEGGSKLSGGQKQKLAIVRALLEDSKILIFDEATSALDNISQGQILKDIESFLKDKIVIIISHRLSTIINANKIYVINNGEIIESGTHSELVENKSIYYNLSNYTNNS